MPLTKEKFRKDCLQRMHNLSKHNRIYRNNLLNNALQKELRNIKHKRILFYYPLPFEADMVKSLLKLRKKCDIYLPFMQGESFKMVPFRLPLRQKKFGIFEAGNTIRNINKVDLAIVPAVGVDKSLKRVGFGKGMYDRFFAKLRKKPYTIFIQPRICYTNKNICDEYDIQCDLLLTPRVKLVNNKRV